MGKRFEIMDGDISDGYHTFDELYEHRCLLFITICLSNFNQCAWKQDHDNWFCLYWNSPKGQISYHIPNKYRKLIEPRIKEDKNIRWDRHTPSEVLVRLYNNCLDKK